MTQATQGQELLTSLHDIARALNSHKAVLEVHEQNLLAAHKTATSHHDEIQTLRAEVYQMHELVDAPGPVSAGHGESDAVAGGPCRTGATR